MFSRTMISNIQWGFEGLRELINIHPVLVPFPIALLLASAAFYLLGVILKREQPFIAGKWTLIAGTAASAFTVWTGLQAAETAPHGGGTHGIMIAHQYLGYAILVLSGILSFWALVSKTSIPERGRTLFLILLAALGGLVVQSADLGGRLVFLYGVGVGRKSMLPQSEGHTRSHSAEHRHEHSEHDHEAHG